MYRNFWSSISWSDMYMYSGISAKMSISHLPIGVFGSGPALYSQSAEPGGHGWPSPGPAAKSS